MQPLFYKATWGMTEPTLEAKLQRIKDAGYDGIEINIWKEDPLEVAERCRLLGLGLVFQVIQGEGGAASLIRELQRMAAFGPELLVTHAGHAEMTFEQGCAYWREMLAAEADLPVPVAHETHRARLLYSPWSTFRYLQQFPALRLNADFSHWCCVSESLLERVPEMLELAIQRAIHIHGRVGHSQGPQVPDPSAPEWAAALAAHESWWDRIRAARQAQGAEALRFVPEFGPSPYMPTLPHSRQPVADLWQVCLWMAERQRGWWQSSVARPSRP